VRSRPKPGQSWMLELATKLGRGQGIAIHCSSSHALQPSETFRAAVDADDYMSYCAGMHKLNCPLYLDDECTAFQGGARPLLVRAEPISLLKPALVKRSSLALRLTGRDSPIRHRAAKDACDTLLIQPCTPAIRDLQSRGGCR
jgi:hypothetical protein